MKKVLVGKGNGVAKYAGTAAAATTANGATNPNDLGEGCIGIYGLNDADADTAGNTDDWVLITSATAAAGKTQDASFKGKYIVIAQGLGNGEFRTSGPIEVAGIQRGVAYDYSAPVKQILSIGYDISLTAGSMNLPATISKGDGVLLKMVRNGVGTQDYDTAVFFLNTTASESQYSIMYRLAEEVNSKGKLKKFVSRVQLASNGTGAVFANSATVTAVYGATSLTTSASHGVGVGDYCMIDGDLYKAVTGTATTTLVLDRPYRGPSATVANVSTLDIGATVPTELGLRIIVYDYNENCALVAQDIIEDGTIVQEVAPSAGVGYAPDVLELEKDGLSYEGAIDTLDARVPVPVSTVDLTKSYNMVFLEWINTHGGFEGSNPNSKSLNNAILAFEDEAQTGGYNMAEVQLILAVLYTSFTAVA